MARRSSIPRRLRVPIGEILREQRMIELEMGLRETARILEITPAHLSDIEMGRRSPSETLLTRIRDVYELDEAVLRTGWSKPEPVVDEVASQDTVTASKVPELLRAARRLTPDQWDELIRHASRLAAKKRRGPRARQQS